MLASFLENVLNPRLDHFCFLLLSFALEYPVLSLCTDGFNVHRLRILIGEPVAHLSSEKSDS